MYWFSFYKINIFFKFIVESICFLCVCLGMLLAVVVVMIQLGNLSSKPTKLIFFLLCFVNLWIFNEQADAVYCKVLFTYMNEFGYVATQWWSGARASWAGSSRSDRTTHPGREREVTFTTLIEFHGTMCRMGLKYEHSFPLCVMPDSNPGLLPR